jgi:hypothetical protein
MGFTLLVAAMTRLEMTIHLESGMDTTFAMAYLCGYLLLFDMWRAHPEGRLRFVVGITGGLAFFARPDLPLFTLLLPACLMIGKSRTERGPIVSTLLITLVGVGACIVFAKLLFGAPLPLSFYAKSTALYGISVWQTYAGVGKEQLLNFVWANWPSLLCIVAGSAAGVRAPVSDRERALLGTILAIAIFWGYYAVFALQIMPFEARFYYPTLPAVLYAAWLALAAVWERRGAPGKPARIVSIVICGAVCLWLGFGSLGSGALSLREWNRTKWFTPFDPVIEYRARYAKYWLFLDKFSTLPDDLIIATGEVGRVAAMNPRKTILDLSGLNDTDIALHGFSAARFFAVHKPDLMYLPHPHYREAWEEILRNPAFAREYDLYPAEDYGVTLDVAVNKASPLYAEMTRIMGQGK